MRKFRCGIPALFSLVVLSGVWVMARPMPAFAASDCTIDAWPNGLATMPLIVYPNWTTLRAGSFDVWLCEGCGGASEVITNLTLVNFGTATNQDITNVYVKFSCGATASGLLPLVYAGNYLADSGLHPAWTWAGASPNLYSCADLCGAPACGGYFTIDVYLDITACPTNYATVAVGFPTHAAYDPVWWGSIYDNNGCAVPWYDLSGDMATIAYTYKEGPTSAIPGDTITYTIYYGKPGTGALSKIDIIDSMPPYTHYVLGSAVPAVDAGWDPNWGSPSRLRWTRNAPVMTGGITEKVVFSLTVDWGNGESFEPGSGDVGAPEGVRLKNVATSTFYNITGAGCPSSAGNPPVSTVVKRFMFWCIGDNDVLFSQTYGQPADEMIYSTFIKNVSTTKTWWKVSVWDTVPADLDVWGADCGFDDPCTGWTMTPTGCVAGYAGHLITGGGTKTLLTWRMDFPPQYTIELKWKAKVSPNAQAKGTVINIVTVFENGQPNTLDGTGSSVTPKRFTHLAPIILPTMYTSYVGYGMGAIMCPGYFLFFEPLNKKTQFELRQLFYVGVGSWAELGGVSASIGNLVGDCFTGFPAGGIAGCRAERVPALYDPTNSNPGLLTNGYIQCPDEVFPRHWIHKMTSNSPTLWQCLTWDTISNQDNHTYAPATTLSYTGLMHYVWKRSLTGWMLGWGDGLAMVNTGMDPYGVYNPTMETAVYIFKFNYTSLTWELWENYDLGPESAAYAWNTGQDEVGPYRTVSSEGQLIINQGIETNQSQDGGGRADNNAAYFPTRETGNTVSLPGQEANFYGVHNCQGLGNKVVIGNLSSVSSSVYDATYRIWQYRPDSLVPPYAGFPPYMVGSSGTWVLKGTHNVPGGIATPENPREYDGDGTQFFVSNAGMLLSKVELISGGPIQVLAGFRVYSIWAGGAVMHAADGKQTGIEYWLHYTSSGDADGVPKRSTYAIDVFCPKNGMIINLTSGLGLSVTYTTTGPDQCVSFLSGKNVYAYLQWPADSLTNYKISVLPGAYQGNVVAQFIAQTGSEKGYTAPFLQEGVHYEIIAPPVVFYGQSFWITIIVKDTSGITKTDYEAVSSFTSTDPTAKILGSAMGTEVYTWYGCGSPCGVAILVNVQFTKIGMQTIVAMDTMDGSINGLTAIMVVAADIKFDKRQKLSIAASGDTVQFRICWSNYSNATGYTFTITDAVPRGTVYVPELSDVALCGWKGPYMPEVVLAASTSVTTAPPTNFATVPAGSAPSGGNATRWLRWIIPNIYVNSTGCVCFKVVVN